MKQKHINYKFSDGREVKVSKKEIKEFKEYSRAIKGENKVVDK